jgi:hypothetical protein
MFLLISIVASFYKFAFETLKRAKSGCFEVYAKKIGLSN